MISEKHAADYPASSIYPVLNPPSVSETLGDNPTLIQSPNPSEGRQRKGSFNESEEIQKEMQELRRRDEEEYHRKQQEVRRRIEQHVNQNGGDLSYLLSQHIPHDVKCIQLTGFGLSKNIQTAKVPLPLPMKHEVLIRTYSCGVNFQDIMTRNGMLDNWVKSLKPPFIMGSEVAGEIVGLGRNVNDLNLGDRVLALPERKAWSEYVVCRAEHCFKIPDEMNYHDAVALTIDGIVAHSLLFQIGNLRPGKAVLLHSTPGGLGTMVTQMARTVPNTRIFKIAMNKEEGQGESADEVVHYIEHDADYVSEIRHSSPHGVDLVLDCQYEDNFNRDFNLLRPLGKYILFGTQAAINRGFFDSARSWWGQEKISPLKLYEENKSICGFNLRNLLYFQKDRPYVREVFCKICKMWQDGEIQAVFDCKLHFDDYNEALQRMQEHGQCGKIILDPTMTREDSLHERDYYVQAQENVRQRRKQQQTFLNRLGLPEPGELVRDKGLEDENKQAKRQQEQEDVQKKMQQEYYPEQQRFPGLQPPPFPTRKENERGTMESLMEKITPSFLTSESSQSQPQPRTETVEIRPTGFMSAEPPIVYDPSSGRTVYNTPPQETFSLPQPPSLSPYSVENVLATIPTASEPLPQLTPTAPSTFQTTELESQQQQQQPILTKEKVELTVPMSQKEMEHLKEEIPAAMLEEKKQHGGFLEKLRETFSPHRSE